MNEHAYALTNSFETGDAKSISTKLFRTANMAPVISSDPNCLR